MVKTLHSFDDIAARVATADGHRVRLRRDSQKPDAPRTAEVRPVDPSEAVIGALAEPLDYPPLAAGTVPGDRVAIALDEAVPCAAQVVKGVLAVLHESGIEPDAISMVTTDANTARICREALHGAASESPQIVVHDPDDEENLCLVGVTKRRAPLLVNRTIFDADIVLPIGCARLHGMGPYDGLFPRFSSAEAIGRHRMPANSTTASGQEERMRDADEAGWLIGAPMIVQVVPGAGNTVAEVVAGDPRAVTRRCHELCRQKWLLHSPQLVDLVIATITGGPLSQTWENVGRALAAAERVLTEYGAVAICSNLEEPPGKSLGRLVGTTDLERIENKICHDHGDDSWPAWHVARALQRGPVYLLSQLGAETVEDMGFAPITDIAEVVRLAGRHESFVVLEDSQHAVVAVAGEEHLP